MIGIRRLRLAGVLFAAGGLGLISAVSASAPQPDSAEVVRHIDAAVRARFEGIAGFTVTEHYTVFRGSDEVHPAAEMTVKTSYQKDTGKTYTILSESGSGIILRFGLTPLLENEKRINDPASREASWFTSANYEMKLKTGEPERVNGHDCLALTIAPKRKAPNLIIGTIWVDAKDYSILRIEGKGTKSPSMWSGPAEMTRDYAEFSGFSEATHARAVSNSSLFGQTVVMIDYRDYQIQLRAGQSAVGK
jgi:outer membrane lipoprotein-sorting protein